MSAMAHPVADQPDALESEETSSSVEATPHSTEAVQTEGNQAEVAEAAQDLAPLIEAVLVSRSRPVGAEALARGLGLLGSEGEGASERKAALAGVGKAIDSLNEAYQASGRSFRIEQVAGGYRVVTLPKFGSTVASFLGQDTTPRLSRPAIETLAIIAYRQPITRADIEAIRGVACGEVLRGLLERRLIAVTGRAEELGRPMLYGTTKQFLDAFGLASIDDLPAREDGLNT
jgi:segregation and condensation protein B